MNNEKILVTGATGFVGRHLIKKLRNDGQDVYGWSEHGSKEASIRAVNVLDIVTLRKELLMLRPTVIYHLGGMVNLERDYEIGIKCLKINALGTFHLFEALREASPKKVILVSTEEVYGKGLIPYKEDQLTYPPSPYAISKMTSEYISQYYGALYHYNVVICRISTTYGPGEQETRFIPSVIIKALRNIPISLNSGQKKRDYVFVQDVVKGLMNAATADMTGSMIINIGGGTSISLLSLVEKIVTLCQSTSSIKVGTYIDRLNEADEWLMEISRANEVLDWKPTINLETGLKTTIEYYKNAYVTH